jgi:hypothetical protein
MTWFSTLSETQPAPGGGDQTNAFAWGVPEDKVMVLGPLNDRCAVSLAKVDDPETNTKVTRAECRVLFIELKALMEDLHTYFYVKDFPVEALARLGLLPRKKPGGPPKPDPTDHVECRVEYDPTADVIYLHYKRIGVKSTSKGKNHGVEVLSVVLPLDAPAPVDDDDFTHSDIDTANPFPMRFKPHQAGMRVWFKLRWENGTGGKGEWSVLYSAIVP